MSLGSGGCSVGGVKGGGPLGAEGGVRELVVGEGGHSALEVAGVIVGVDPRGSADAGAEVGFDAFDGESLFIQGFGSTELSTLMGFVPSCPPSSA